MAWNEARPLSIKTFLAFQASPWAEHFQLMTPAGSMISNKRFVENEGPFP